MIIKIDDIVKLTLMLVQNTQERGLKQIELPSDFYWTVSDEDRENVYNNPKCDIGSLVDDIQELQRVLNGEREMVNIDLDRLANIILSVSHHMDRIGFFL